MSTKQLNPGPLGLAAFAMTTTALSLINVGILSKEGVGVVIALALAYGGLIQLFVGWAEGKAGSTFGFVAFSSYGAFWIYYGILNILAALGLVRVNVATAGVVLILWGFLTLYLWVASLKASLVTSLVFLFLTLTFMILGIGDVMGLEIGAKIGGFLGLITAALAWYNSLAVVINENFGKTVVPLGKPLK